MSHADDRSGHRVSRIVMLGDSLTHFGNWPALLPDHDVLNFGVSGNTSQQLWERVEPPLQSAPDLVTVLIGTNDVGHADVPPREVVHNLERITAAASTVAPVLVQSLLPREPRHGQVLRALNDDYREVADRLGVSFLDLWPHFEDGRDGLRSELTTDGLHLSASGYRKWSGLLGPVLVGLLAAETMS
ncbi:GDSL-type esterase/lipase family protein [Streptomyces sp. NPDC088747]|uniref:GDSL-type esterase/lipase family protein n=1 Tax=Streptomyces sp. NPDC088747 TaxID=3365886 RepID=UPI00381697B5